MDLGKQTSVLKFWKHGPEGGRGTSMTMAVSEIDLFLNAQLAFLLDILIKHTSLMWIDLFMIRENNVTIIKMKLEMVNDDPLYNCYLCHLHSIH